MYESIFDNGRDWQAIELRMLRNRIANLFQLLNLYTDEEAQAAAFLMDKEQLEATLADLENKKITMMGIANGKALWAEEGL